MRNIIAIFLCLILFTQPLMAAEILGNPERNQENMIALINDQEYGLQPDHKVDFIIHLKEDGGEKRYSNVEVFPNGMMIVPLIGETQVYDVSVSKLEEIMIQKNQDIESVEIFIHRIPNNVSVLGEVNAPGSYGIADIKTVYDAIGKAKGFTRVAKRSKVKLIRQRRDGTRIAYIIDFPKEVFNAYEEGSGIGEEIYLLREGDLIWVPGSGPKKVWEIFKKALSAATFGVFTGITAAVIND